MHRLHFQERNEVEGYTEQALVAGTDCHLEVWRSGCWNMESWPGCSLPHLPPPTSCCLALITPLSLSLGSWEHYREISLVHSTSGYLVTSTSQVSQVSLLAGPRHAGDWRSGRGAAAADQLPCGEAPCREYRTLDRPPRRRRPPHSHTLTRGGDTASAARTLLIQARMF